MQAVSCGFVDRSIRLLSCPFVQREEFNIALSAANRRSNYSTNPEPQLFCRAIHFVDRLSCAVIFFQGLEDRVVPPNQSRIMANALRTKGLPVAVLTFQGEQHGFRKRDTIVRCLEAEVYFYGAVFGFVPADRLSPGVPVAIDNIER